MLKIAKVSHENLNDLYLYNLLAIVPFRLDSRHSCLCHWAKPNQFASDPSAFLGSALLPSSIELGHTVPELAEPLSNLDSLHNGTLAKTMFSMVTPNEEAIKVLQSAEAQSAVIFGLEVCTAFTRFLSGAYTILTSVACLCFTNCSWSSGPRISGQCSCRWCI